MLLHGAPARPNLISKMLGAARGGTLQPLLALRGGNGLGGATSALLAGLLAADTPAAAAAAAAAPASTLADAVALVLGYCMMAGAMLVYSPMILQVVTKRSGDGLSRTAWAMSVVGFGGALCYQLSKGYPISTFGELIALTAQSVVLFGLMQFFDHNVGIPSIAGGLAAFLGVLYVLVTRAPQALLQTLQAISAMMLSLAIVPQLALNFRTGTCGWSMYSAMLSTMGNGIRVFTTLQVTKDRLVLVGFIGGLTLNLILLAQTLTLPNPTEG